MRYRKISVGVWNDERVRQFTDDGKLAFLFLLTHPGMTSVGAMRGTRAGLAAELGWSPRRLERALTPATRMGMVEINEAAAFIGLPKFLRHNPPDNVNVVKSWISAIADHVPECPERAALIRRCRAFLDGLDQSYREAFTKALAARFPEGFQELLAERFGEPPRIQEQEQKQEQDTPQPPKGDCQPTSSGAQFEEFYALYPRKMAPRAAQRAWSAALKKTTSETLLDSLRRQLPEFSRRPRDRVPYPATWLNGEHWRNEPDGNGNDPNRLNDAWAGVESGEVKL